MKRQQRKEIKNKHKEAVKLYKERAESLKRLSDQEKKVYDMLNDPNNEFMHSIRYGGDEALQEHYRRDV